MTQGSGFSQKRWEMPLTVPNSWTTACGSAIYPPLICGRLLSANKPINRDSHI